jgi:hypothetical protein
MTVVAPLLLRARLTPAVAGDANFSVGFAKRNCGTVTLPGIAMTGSLLPVFVKVQEVH